MVRVYADLPGGALAPLFDVAVSGDEKAGPALCEFHIDLDQFIRNLAVSGGHGFGRCGPDETVTQLQTTYPTRSEIRRQLHAMSPQSPNQMGTEVLQISVRSSSVYRSVL